MLYGPSASDHTTCAGGQRLKLCQRVQRRRNRAASSESAVESILVNLTRLRPGCWSTFSRILCNRLFAVLRVLTLWGVIWHKAPEAEGVRRSRFHGVIWHRNRAAFRISGIAADDAASPRRTDWPCGLAAIHSWLPKHRIAAHLRHRGRSSGGVEVEDRRM